MALTIQQRTFLAMAMDVQPVEKDPALATKPVAGNGDMKGAADSFLKLEKETLDHIRALRALPGTKKLVRRLETETKDIRDHVGNAAEAGQQDIIETGTKLLGDLCKTAKRAVEHKDFYESHDAAVKTLNELQEHPQHEHVEYETVSAESTLDRAHRQAEDSDYDEALDDLAIANERLREARRCADRYAGTMVVRTEGERIIHQLKEASVDDNVLQDLVSDFEAAAQQADVPSRRYGRARTEMQAVIDRMKAALQDRPAGATAKKEPEET